MAVAPAAMAASASGWLVMPQTLRIGSCGHQLSQSAGGVAGFHEVFADQEGVVAGGAQADDIGGVVDAAFADQERAGGHVFGESERGIQSDFEGGEIAIVDADEVGAGVDGGVEFAGGCGLRRGR